MPCLYEADHRHGDEHRQRQDRRHRDVRGGGEAAGDQREQVGEEDEQEQGHDVGEVFQPLACRRRPRSSCRRSRRPTRPSTAPARGPARGRASRRSSAALTATTASAIQSVALVGVYQWTGPSPNSGWTSNCSIGWMLNPLPPASLAIGRPLSPCRGFRRASARLRLGRSAPPGRCGASSAPRRRSPAGRTPPGRSAGCRRRRPARSPIARPRHHAHDQLDHHPPGERPLGELAAGARRFGSARLALARGDPVLESLQTLGKGFVRHRPALPPGARGRDLGMGGKESGGRCQAKARRDSGRGNPLDGP